MEGPAFLTIPYHFHPSHPSTLVIPTVGRDLQCALRCPRSFPENCFVQKFAPLDNPYSVMQHVIMRHVVKDAKPLSEPVMLMLTSLASEPKHGYALLKDVEELSNGRVQLSTGTLYGAIHRLLEDR